MDILKKIPLMTTLHGAMTTDPAEDTVADGLWSSLHDTWAEMWASTFHIYAGTLVVVGTGTVLGTSIEAGNLWPIAFAFGMSWATLHYAMGRDMNPSISFYRWFHRDMSFMRMLWLWAGQFLGGILASALVWASLGTNALSLGSTALNENLKAGNGFLLEFMGTLFMLFVWHKVQQDHMTVYLMGVAMAAVNMMLLPFTGAGINPARVFGPSMVQCMAGDCAVTDHWWIYWIGPFAASYLVLEFDRMNMPCEKDGGAAVNPSNHDEEEGSKA